MMGKNPGGVIMLRWAHSQDTASVLQDNSCHPCKAALAIVAVGCQDPQGLDRRGWLSRLGDGSEACIELSFFKATGVSITQDL